MSGSTPTTPTDCTAGTYSPAGEGYCKVCPIGTFSNAIAAFCSPCPRGFTCNNPSQPPQLCEVNKYWNNAGKIPKCAPCPAGYRCENATLPPIPCSTGSYSPEGITTCSVCSAGFQCPDPSQLPQSCPEGTYAQQGSTYCRQCPPGYSCPTPNSVVTQCPKGSYSLVGQANCTVCPVGSMCSTTMQAATRCPLGTTTFGNKGADNCTDCPAGSSCPTPESSVSVCSTGQYSLGRATRCYDCPAGHKCPQKNQKPVACTPGSWSAKNSEVCHDCPAGDQCPSVASSTDNKQCIPGTYSNGSQQHCTVCPESKYCPNKDKADVLDCQLGYFSVGGQASCHPCPSGFECPRKDGSGNVKCLPGSFSTGAQVQCTPCPAGMACPYTNTNQTITCQPGTFSVGSQTVCTPCPPGYQCPSTTTSQKIPCQVGTYSIGSQQNCTNCPAGYACPSTTDDFKVLCPAGYYTTGNAKVCDPCPAGSYCPNITINPLPCPSGTYTLGSATECTACPAGYFCAVAKNAPVKCSIGTYSNHSATVCTNCDPGYVCKDRSRTPRPVSGRCPMGYYCPDGARKEMCPSGTFGNTTGAADAASGCDTCPAGFFCPAATVSYPSYRLKCPPGHFCLEGTKQQYQSPCPAGTYSRAIGFERQDQCLECLQGYYCPAGDQYGDRLCPPGHYCPANTGNYRLFPCDAGYYTEEQGARSKTDCRSCLPGYYCPSGKSAPIPCPAGKYNSLSGRGSLSDCRSCSAGMACPQPALTAPPVKCDAGHYCPQGSVLPNATVHACPAGTYTDYHNLTHYRECTQCPVGQSCEAGTGGRQKQPQLCATGHYCPLGTMSPTQFPCTAGSWTNLTNIRKQDECYDCPKGWFCLQGSPTPTALCATGHYCPRGTQRATQFPCAPGTYSNKTGNVRWEQCEACPEGHYCPQGSSVPKKCPKGTYNDLLSAKDLSGCKACVPGYYCPGLGNFAPTACTKGNYSASGAYECSTCEAGYYCASKTTSRSTMLSVMVCPASMHCPPGTDQAPDLLSHACPVGSYCVRGDENAYPIKCPNGTFNPNAGRKHVSECQTCWEGWYCEPSGRPKPADQCPPGYYCPAGTGYKYTHPCPVGFYRKASAAISIQDCSVCYSGYYCDVKGLPLPNICPEGHFCPTGTTIPQPCPNGYYGNSTGVKRSEECTPCPAGQYCAGFGLKETTGDCDAGFYCRSRAYTSAPPEGSTGGLCPAGGYCPKGCKTPFPCPVGTYSASKGAKAPEDCIVCDPGHYCAGDTNPTPTGKCSPGHYCTNGSSTPIQHVTPKGHYSKEGSSAPVACPVGTFQETDRASQCTKCTENNFCNDTAMQFPRPCLSGHYCPAGSIVPVPCPVGKFNPDPGKGLEIACRLCEQGRYCAKVGLSASEGDCDAGYYCIKGSPSRTPDNGTFNNATYLYNTSINYEYGGVCPPGYFCPQKSYDPYANRCPNGTYSNQRGLASASECIDCPPGEVCNGVALTSPNGKCRAGWYCIKRASTPMPLDGVTGNICPVGYYCPNGTDTFKECVAGTYSNVTGLAACLECPSRYYCKGGAYGATPYKCPPGHYCPAGTGLSQKKCIAGTWNKHEGLESQSECEQCPGGYYCEGAGVDKFPSPNSGQCHAGFYCVKGIDIPRPSTGFNGIGGVCTRGHYCPIGTAEPIGCPNGTFSNVTQLQAASDCTQCSYGNYCEESKLTEPTGKCDPGFYCLRGSNTARPSIKSPTGGPCTKGHFCPEGTAFPIGCRSGTFNPNEGEAECFTCPKGYYCPENSTNYISYPCPEGHYCPNGTKFPTKFPCPKGHFNNRTNGERIEDCFACPGGMYCNSTGLTGPTAECAPGWFCVRGAWSDRPVDYDNYTSGDCLCPSSSTGGECQPGFYCPQGSHEPKSCTGGHYCEVKGKDKVTGKCEAGYFCTSGASAPRPLDGVTGNICPPGHYCEIGTTTPRKCPEGTFSNDTGNKNISDCLPCTKGKYCPGLGNTKPFGDCDPGFYCPPGQQQSQPFSCTKGHYCERGSPAPVVCQPGRYQDETQKDSCKICPAGYYCDNKDDLSSFNSYVCPKGYFCPNGTQYATEFGCPNGTYGNDTLFHSADQCTSCPPGKYCLGSSDNYTGDCEPGFHCILRSHSPTPTNGLTGRVCPEGQFCVKGTPAPENCPPGTYSNVTKLRAIGECVDCTPGKFCKDAGLTKPSGDCSPRYYCKGKASYPAPQDGMTGGNCTPGHFCPGGTPKPIPCLDGSYMKEPLAERCIDCPKGFFCVNDKSQDPEPCPQGYYCPTGTGFDWKPCPKGAYGDTTGLANETSCRPCSAGMFCAYTNGTSETGACSAGYYCRQGADTPTPGVGAHGDAGPCPAGSYCPQKTGEPKKCPIGHYSNTTHLKNSSDCELCQYGHYCGEPGLTNYSGPCDPGFYCRRGSEVPNPPDVTASGGPCPVGHFCKRGTSHPQPCLEGTYNNRTGQSECQQCCAGYYCPEKSISCLLECPQGHYCLPGTKQKYEHPCPPGYYNDGMRSQSSSDCKPCTQGKFCNRSGLAHPAGDCEGGWYCILASKSSKPTDSGVIGYCNGTKACFCPNTTTGGKCQQGEYCPIGSSEPIPCMKGHFCDNSGLSNVSGPCEAGFYCLRGAKSSTPTDNTTGDVCPKGHYCPVGTYDPQKCPLGKFSNSTGNRKESDCRPCLAGKYCGSLGLEKPSGDCSAGYYCPGGQSTGTPSGHICTPGHHCPTGIPSQRPCASGLYQDEYQQPSCKTCPEGFFCDATIMNVTHCLHGVQLPSACPTGHYCLNETKFATQHPCPNGTYNNVTRIKKSEDCSDCPAGKYCEGTGNKIWSGDCSPGFHCIGRASTKTPNGGVTGVVCPRGHFCPAGIPSPLPCKAGTYGPTEQLESQANCKSCDPGQYCGVAGLNKTTGNCSAGFYCRGNASVRKPANDATGGDCYIGHYCPPGTATPQKCPPGYYMNHTRASQCYVCPNGHYCVDGIHPIACPAGWYCPEGTGYDWRPCPRGTYSPVEFLSRESQCKPCEPGYFCAFINATSVTGQCDAGFFCRNGSDSRQPSGGNTGDAGVCMAGYYCPKGHPNAPIACQPGYYNNQTHRYDISHCRKCPGGKFCDKAGLEWPSGKCQPGYYCKERATSPNPVNTTATGGPCPPGSYCTEGSSFPMVCPGGQYNSLWRQSQCSMCPEGHFCPNASSSYQICPEGYYCPNGSDHARECPKGTYKNYTMGNSLDDCKMCPPGKYCPLAGMPKPEGLCDPGWYCTGGSWEKKPLNTNDIANGTAVCPLIGSIGGFCKKGEFCPAGADRPRPCTPGYFCQNDYLDKESGLCTAGYYCNGSTIDVRPENKTNGDRCPKGYYCPTGSAYPKSCSPGTYSDKEYNQFRNNCMPCLPGMYCASYGLPWPSGNCSEGYYCPTGETLQSPPNKECQPGHMCPEGSGIHNPCPAGSYQPYPRKGFCNVCPAGSYCDPNEARINKSSGANSSSHGVVTPSDCPAGYYCPSGTKSAHRYPCPEGRFGNQTKLTEAARCTPCSKGYYCQKSGITEPTALCYAGYYCVEGAKYPNPNDTHTGAPCPPGYYCESGYHQPAACPKGTFGPKERLTKIEECVDCYGGQYCAEDGLASPNGSCDPGYYCKGRAIKSNPVSEVYGDICPRGHYCPAGTTTPFKCPPGSYNNKTRAPEPSDCISCEPGYYCEGYGLTSPTDKCEGGWYCTRGAYTKRPVPQVNLAHNNSNHFTCPLYSLNFTGGICTKGNYCPKGSSKQLPCPAGKFCGSDGLSSPSGDCTAGYFCQGGNTVSNPVNCSAGYYCPEGSPIEMECPPGTYLPYTGKSKKTDCLNCTAGYYCPLSHMTHVIFECLQGNYCPSGSVNNNTVVCPRGFSCPTGSGTPQRCIPGEYQNEEGQWKCKTCDPGYYCDPTSLVTGVIKPSNCTPGHYCPMGTKYEKEFNCSAGTYSNQYNLREHGQCTHCPSKQFCGSPGLTAPTALCSPGYVCTGSASSPTPDNDGTGKKCPTGRYCPEGSDVGELCPRGTFNNETGLMNASQCRPCTPGYYCPTSGIATNPTQKCSKGYWCSGGSTENTPVNKPYGTDCPNGSYCPEGTPIPVDCPKGTYNPYRGKEKMEDCVPCDPGKYCETPGKDGVTSDCNAGYYCKGNASKPNPSDGNTGDICPQGHYCEVGSKKPQPCANGTYMNETGSSSCRECPEGYQCIKLIHPEPCPAGSYCPKGVGYDIRPCPVGTYGGQTGLSRESQCTQCSGGSYCELPGISKVTADCAGGFFCTSGVNVESPSSGFKGVGGRCYKGHECPPGTSTPSACKQGYYANQEQMATCTVCPAGKFCNGTTITPFDCPQGHYCPNGTRFATEYPCKPGTFNNETSQPSEASCQLCPAGKYCQGAGRVDPNGPCDPGFYCSGGSWSNRPGDIGAPNYSGATSPSDTCYTNFQCVCPAWNKTTGDICPAGSYCPGGSEKPRPCKLGQHCAHAGLEIPTADCSQGYYCNDSSTVPDQFECPTGHYCPIGTGVPRACPSGTFSDTQKNVKVDDCRNCTAGRYCAGTGLSAPTDKCSANFYCPGGQDTATPAEYVCSKGHYCPRGSENPKRCENGTYQNEEGKSFCKDCPAGYYCDPISTPVITPSVCEKGYYCPYKTTSYRDFPCPERTYNDHTGLPHQDNCTTCTRGYYCATPGLEVPTASCHGGYYCTEGSKSPTPIEDISAAGRPGFNGFPYQYLNDKCPPGFFCPNGSDPQPCKPGTYHNQGGIVSSSQCHPCPVGRYCNGSVVPLGTAPQCDAGYVCTGGSNTPKPTDPSMGYMCPAGFKCPSGTNFPLSCEPGRYQPNRGRGECIKCLPGSECPYQNMTVVVPCRRGYYCPDGTPSPCPPGTFGNKSGLITQDMCTDCPSGQYCEGAGKTKPKGSCHQGHYCQGGANSSTPHPNSKFPDNGPCPTGSYCVEGTPAPQKCPPGTFRNTTGADSAAECLDCRPGWYCGGYGNKFPTAKCARGYFCPQGSRTNVSHPSCCQCPVDHYCPQGSAEPVKCDSGSSTDGKTAQWECKPCPAGYYCSPTPQKCPPKHHCPAGTVTPILCPSGTFTYENVTGLANASQCSPCVAGHYCLAGVVAGQCVGGYFCKSRSPSPTPSFQLGNQENGPCKEGHYCPNATITPIPCPDNTMKNYTGGDGTVSDCKPCIAGRYCYNGTAKGLPCPKGRYCLEGQYPIKCSLLRYRDVVGGRTEADCFACPAGYWCNVTGMVDFRNSKCPVGHYCYAGQKPELCYPGFRREVPGARNHTECSPCPGGYYCPSNTTNTGGIPCREKYYCKPGSSQETICPGGYFCNYTTSYPYGCSAGHYCPNGSSTEYICRYPEYCPPVTAVPLKCPLGYQALNNSGLRPSLLRSCQICPAGTYGNDPERHHCDICPAGYFCPVGCIGPKVNPCPEGYYCPEQSGDKWPCQAGRYGNRTLASSPADCFPCPFNTFNNVPGRTACRPCGSSAKADTGQALCTCIGKNRAFRISDGACSCYAGYVFYDQLDKEQIDGNSDKSCQREVDIRCTTGQLRDSFNRGCVVPSTANDECVKECKSLDPPRAGEFNQEFGQCMCDQTPVDCNLICQKNKPTVKVQRNPTTGELELTYSGNSKKVSLKNEIGVNDFDYKKHPCEVLSYGPEGVEGYVPRNAAEADEIIKPPLPPTPQARRRRRSVTNSTQSNSTTTPTIINPMVCLEFGEAIVFKISINNVNRSLSNYPRYQKNHLFNKNEKFDYGNFRHLHELVTKTNKTLSFFVHVFAEGGTYVFYDNANTKRQSIVRVMDRGSSCKTITGGLNVMVASVGKLHTFGVKKSEPQNLVPNWEVIYGMTAFMLICVVMLVIAVVIWRPRSFGRYPVRALRPKYKALGAPVPVVPIPGIIDSPEELGPRGIAEGAISYESRAVRFELENFNVKTLYDKLEDQTLHVSSQLARHQQDLRGFYDRISQQAEKLKEMLNNMDVSALIKATKEAGRGEAETEEYQQGGVGAVDVPKHYGMTGGSLAREQELMRSLQILMERAEKGQFAMPGASVFPQGGIIGAAPAVQFIGGSGGIASGATILTQSAVVEASAVEIEGRTVGWHVQGTSDVSEFLRRMNAERIHLEQGLQREEESETHKVLKTHV